LKQLRARHRLILTGTPIQNRVCELWSLFDFLMPDFLGSESTFVARFSRPVAASRDPKATRVEQRAGHLALESLHRLVLPFMLRRLKEDVMLDLPPKIIQDFACEMTSVQLILYETFMKSNEGRVLLKNINLKHEDGDEADSLPTPYGAVRHGFQALRYLQAVCNHPCLALKPTHPILSEVKRLLQTEYGPRVSLDSVHLSGKLLALCRLLTDCGFGTPNFGSSTDSTNPFSSTSLCNTGSSTDDLEESSRALLNQHRALIFFQTREMLRLTEEMLSYSVSEHLISGAMDRVHRIGQRRTVNVYRLITQDSIEEQIMNLQAFKLHLANTVVSTDNRHLSGMDTGHLFDRFTTASRSSTGDHQDRPTGSDVNTLDSLEECYETEYNLDAFVARLK
uniref:SNF2_N domain-containing protein n=1 Tax=Echinostoma caproni TaxID=27848 RepID=A0A183AMW0_9TREM